MELHNYMEENKNEEIDKSKEAVKQDAKGLLQSVRTFMKELLDFRPLLNCS